MKLKHAQNWVRWFAVLGTSLFVGGVAWVAVLSYRIKDVPEDLKYDVRMPWTPRLMVFLGFALLVIVAVHTGTHYLRARKSSGRG